ncbi:MAG: NYN domain-containing protein, partial [Hyphomicrobiaceae bacterium]|nr:NYN domain-containing protein [Hyphomicrobiaceae bacterium]
MKRDANGPALSAIFVDYDNIYLSLKRKNEDAAKRFSKDAALWLRELENGALITATSGFSTAGPRRIVMNRCYGNPVPRRNSHDNSTDMNSFPFIRHHFLRAGAEVIDCPPLTAQLKNSADIRIVMDVRDMITHDTYFDEFIILSSDADFTPLLHRLRAHARRTVIYANDQTASPYTAISDGEVREADLLRLLLDTRGTDRAIPAEAPHAQLPQPGAEHSLLRRDLANEAANLVRAAGQPVPLEALADRLVRQFGHERTSGSNWAGMGGFRDLMASYLPDGIKISEQAPFVVFDTTPPEAMPRLDAQALPPRAAAPTPPEAVPHALPPLRQPRIAPDAPRLAQTPAVPGQPRTVAQPTSLAARATAQPAMHHPAMANPPASQPALP